MQPHHVILCFLKWSAKMLGKCNNIIGTDSTEKTNQPTTKKRWLRRCIIMRNVEQINAGFIQLVEHKWWQIDRQWSEHTPSFSSFWIAQSEKNNELLHKNLSQHCFCFVFHSTNSKWEIRFSFCQALEMFRINTHTHTCTFNRFCPCSCPFIALKCFCLYDAMLFSIFWNFNKGFMLKLKRISMSKS